MKDKIKNNLGLKLAAVLFATMLWLVVVSIDDPLTEETFRTIPVNVINGDIYTTQGNTFHILEGNEKVNVIVSARRSDLRKIHLSDIVVTADIKYRVANANSEATIPTSVKIKGFDEKLYKATTTPGSIQIAVESHTTKKFPINVATIGTPRDGYVLGDLTPNPAYINIAGGESQVQRIKKVIAKVDVSGISKNGKKDADLILYDSNDKIIDQSLLQNNLGEEGLKVNVEVLKTKTLPLKFDTSEIKAADGYAVASVDYEPKSLMVAGTREELQELDKIVVSGAALKFANLRQSQVVDIDVKEYLPENIKLADETLGKVVVSIVIEKYGTKVLTIPVGSIIQENTLTGLTPRFATLDDVELTVQGSAAALSHLVNEPKVYVDLEQYTTAGTYNVPVQIELPKAARLCGMYPYRL